MSTGRQPKRPPARLRYAADHPTVTIHLPDRATYARLDELAERSGLSRGQIVKQALGLVEKGVAQDEAAYLGAYCDGQMDALEAYGLSITCSICGEPIDVEAGSEMAKAAVALLVERGWAHGGACSARRDGRRPA
ncbi:MAG: ribbon-helix-helix protein, CopG family [Candidatus Dormibacteria bacterium]